MSCRTVSASNARHVPYSAFLATVPAGESSTIELPSRSSEVEVEAAVPASQAACSECSLRRLCLPQGLSWREMARLDAVIGAPRRLARGDHLYRTGAALKAVYMVRSGFFKTTVPTHDCHEQVTGFQMSGEILGIDGICNDVHTCDAVALEDSQVCLIPFSGLEALASEMPALQRHFNKLMGREIVRDQGVMMLLGTMRVEERLAAFLLNLSQRLAARGYSPVEFHLRMSREDIGSYLGLQQETVSRAFSSFQEEGLVTVHSRHIRILDICGLKAAMARLHGLQWLRRVQRTRSPALAGCSLSFQSAP